MHKKDEELIAQIEKEKAEHGLEFKNDVPEPHLHEVLKRLIETPPSKVVRGEHEKRRRGRRRQ
ncbi:MAG TPA: hypothetical protein VKS22_03335 [Candidatus Binataceae bacterium]|nr:hypothetical protein [Candidatus Binataceae bacterium]